MSVNFTPDMSIWLYDHLRLIFVGSEDYVKLIRLMNASKDQMNSNATTTCITSGSFGEGLELAGSDLDIMFVEHDLVVTGPKKIRDSRFSKAYFFLDTEDVKPGFAYLRLNKGNLRDNLLINGRDEGQLFLSSVLFKQHFRSESLFVVHGPCLSDIQGDYDVAHCLHAKSWITTASAWVTRSNNSWPSVEIKQRIIDHGVLFVPIGTKSDMNEELHWRISFSVGEKFLIYSFSHTQLLCYALMKILLKDVISQSPGCSDLLCSYFIKTILFWICEEVPTSVWKPDNLIPCFIRCFKRLIYCVEQSMCPHYFIPEHNLFETKIIGHGRTQLLETLYFLIDYLWSFIYFSRQECMLSLSCGVHFNVDLFSKDVEKIINSKVLMPFDIYKDKMDYTSHVQQIIFSQTKILRSIYLRNMTQYCSVTAQTMQPFTLQGNTYKYQHYKQCLCYLLQSIHQDVVTGWLVLASLFYKMKQYNKALYILSYSLTKCTTEKLYIRGRVSDLHWELFRLKTFKELGLVRSLRFLFVSYVDFPMKSSLIPHEMNIDALRWRDYTLPSVAYLHFLSFLCHFHQQNVKRYQESLGDLRLTIEEGLFLPVSHGQGTAYECLGVAFQIIGDMTSAREAFLRSVEVYPASSNNSFERLEMMDQL